MARYAAAPAALAALASGLFLGLGRQAAPAAHARPVVPAWPPLRSAGDFLVADIRTKLAGRWEVAWRTLYPAHRRIASRWSYASCERETPFTALLRSVRVLSVRREPVEVAGLTRTLPGVAVRVRLELGWYGSRDPMVVAHTFHLVPVRGSWTWLLSPDRYRLYRAGACGMRLSA